MILWPLKSSSEYESQKPVSQKACLLTGRLRSAAANTNRLHKQTIHQVGKGMRWPNMTLPRYGNSAFTHYPWVSLVCLTNIFQCVSVQSCRNILHVILKKSGSCDHGLTRSVPVPACCICSGSDRCLRCDGKPVTARRGEMIFDQLLSSNISVQFFPSWEEMK